MASTQPVDPIQRAKDGDQVARQEHLGANGREVNIPYDKFKHALKYGIIAGVLIGIYQFILNAAQDGINIGMGLIGWMLIAPVLWFALRELKNHYAAGEFFKNAAIMTMYVSFIAAVITAIIAFVGYAVGTGDATEIVSVEGITPGQLAANCVFQIFVGMVIGNTIGFIFMQGMKTDVVADEFIEKQTQ